MTLRVAALISGDPGPVELWTLRALARVPIELAVVEALVPTGQSRLQRLARLRRDIGVVRVASRLVGNQVIGRSQNRMRDKELDLLFDGDDLRRWWRASGPRPINVPYLNHADTRAELLKFAADLVVRVSGGVLAKRIFSAARVATLNIHHGVAPKIRGMWSIPWGLVKNRPDWIGATIHQIDEGIDTGPVLWRGSPQIAAGDTGTTLFFRAHLEAVDALVSLIREYALGTTPLNVSVPAAEASVYRTSPELPDWIRYAVTGRGLRSEAVLRRAIEC